MVPHFRYGEQALLYLPPDMPDPREPKFTRAAGTRSARSSRSPTAALFACSPVTARWAGHEQLLARVGTRCSAGYSASQRTPGRVSHHPECRYCWELHLSGKVWMSGRAAQCVIIDKLPFAVPSDPVVAARHESDRSRWRQRLRRVSDPFRCNRALKQGFGRLIRSLKDRGVLVLLDPRLQRQRYGRVLWRACRLIE